MLMTLLLFVSNCYIDLLPILITVSFLIFRGRSYSSCNEKDKNSYPNNRLFWPGAINLRLIFLTTIGVQELGEAEVVPCIPKYGFKFVNQAALRIRAESALSQCCRLFLRFWWD
ncbi:hypothetical protein POM88_026655 [Heracleum sosnowskyi]|uniref:Uncharacterized protein n=1 Tax=Heracleum sosnowskyi TaxID=360622 RepID=A0AAD8I6F5_9APIA|nr:hypothetical protein POM88_026655 [Heracleum sosnowskyi]